MVKKSLLLFEKETDKRLLLLLFLMNNAGQIWKTFYLNTEVIFIDRDVAV